jgi:branched-chain amino acid transport system substrate-binding protein
MGAFRGGLDARFASLNAEGGVNGRHVVYTWRDDAAQPDLNLAGARQLVETAGVLGLVTGTTANSGSAQWLADAGIPVTGMSGETVWTEHRNMFAYSNLTASGPSVDVWGRFVYDQGGRRAAVLATTLDPAARTLAQKISESLTAAGVTTAVSLDVDADPSSAQLTRLAETMRQQGIDTIVGSIPSNLLASLLPAVRQAQVDLKVALTPFGYDPLLLQELGPRLAGTTIFMDTVPFELSPPGAQRFLEAMTKYAPYVQPATQATAVIGWLAADMFVRGLAAAGPCPSRQGFIDNLRQVDNYDGSGLLPRPVDFEDTFDNISPCYEFIRVADDGRSFVPYEPSLRCGVRIGV